MQKKLSFILDLDRIITETPVSTIMVRDIKTIKETDTVFDAVNIMSDYSISGLLITDIKDYPVGIVSEGDIIKKVFHKGKDPKKIKISEIMSRHLFTIKPGLSIGEVAVLMKKHNVSKLPIVENDRLVGYVTKSDLLEKMNEIYFQNSKLKYFPIIIMVLLIIISVLLVWIVNKP
jgi:CBS domain-containing protein